MRDKSSFREGLPRRRIKRTRAEGVRKGAEIHLSGGVSTSGEDGQRVILHEAAHIAQQEAAASPERSTTTLRLSSRPTV
ncbi:MAG: DUF4157 domain-containing protein [Oscillospiraceae bacterium]